MEKTVSKYVNNAIASKKKHVYVRLLDYFLTFVVSYLVFTLVLPISSNFSIVQDRYVSLSNISTEMADYIDSTHLQRYNEDKSALVEVNQSGVAYLTSLAKTNAYLHDIPYPEKQEDGTYVDKPVAKEDTMIANLSEYKLDNPSFYYKSFKKNEAGLNDYTIDEVDYKDDIDTYMYIKIMEIDASKYVASDDPVIAKGEGLSRYLILTSDNASLLIKGIAKSESTTAINDLTNYLLGTYVKAIEHGIEEVENKSTMYLDITDRFTKAYQALSACLVVIYLASYLIAYLLLIFIPRLIFKEYKSVGQKVMGVAKADNKDLSLSWWQHVIYYVVDFILLSTSCMIAFLFTGIFGVTSLYVLPHITLLGILLFLLTFNLISLFMPLINKRRFDIPRFLSRIVVKDINEYDVPVGMEAKDEVVGEADGK